MPLGSRASPAFKAVSAQLLARIAFYCPLPLANGLFLAFQKST